MVVSRLKNAFKGVKLAVQARKKLKLAEEKMEARKYIEQAKKAGVSLSEEEALAYVRMKKVGSAFSDLGKKIGGRKYGGKKGKGKRKGKKKGDGRKGKKGRKKR